MRNLVTELVIVRKIMANKDLCHHIITVLDRSYEFVVVSLTSMLHDITFKELYSIFLSYEARLKQQAIVEAQAAFEANMTLKYNKYRMTARRNDPRRCWNPN